MQQPNSRRHILDGTRQGRVDFQQDDGFYNVKRVQASQRGSMSDTSTHMKLRSSTRQREVMKSSLSDIQDDSRIIMNKSRKRLKWYSILFSAFIIVILSAYYHPTRAEIALDRLVLFIRSQVLYKHSNDDSPNVQSLNEDNRQFVKLMGEYNILRLQHEQSVEMLRTLTHRLGQLEAAKSMEQSVKAQYEDDRLRLVNTQISKLTIELRQLEGQYIEVRDRLDQSTTQNSQLQADLLERIENIKNEIDVHNHTERASVLQSIGMIQDLPPWQEGVHSEPNLASYQSGARIVKKFTTLGLADEEQWSFWVGKAAASLFPSGRYQPLIGIRSHPADVILDEHPIRGPGDCFCVKGYEANLTVDLGSPIFVSSVAIQHAPRQLETHQERAPNHVSIFANNIENTSNLTDLFKLELNSKNPVNEIVSFPFNYPQEQWHQERLNPVVRSQRLRFKVTNYPQSRGMCVYRIFVKGRVNDT